MCFWSQWSVFVFDCGWIVEVFERFCKTSMKHCTNLLKCHSIQLSTERKIRIVHIWSRWNAFVSLFVCSVLFVILNRLSNCMNSFRNQIFACFLCFLATTKKKKTSNVQRICRCYLFRLNEKHSTVRNYYIICFDAFWRTIKEEILFLFKNSESERNVFYSKVLFSFSQYYLKWFSKIQWNQFNFENKFSILNIRIDPSIAQEILVCLQKY